MFVGDALLRLHFEAQEDVHNVILINLLHLNTGHIYGNYKHLAYTLHKNIHVCAMCY